MANNQYNFLDYAGLSLFWNNVKSIIEKNEVATASALTNLDTKIDNVESSKADKVHKHSKSQITDFPTSLPASDVYSWAKQSTKPSYSFSEITGKPTTIDGYGITDSLRWVLVDNNIENDFNTFENLTLTGRGDPAYGSSLLNSPWDTDQPAGGFGVLTYLWSAYGLQLAAGYHSNDLYIRNKYYVTSSNGTEWDTKWDKILNSSNYNAYAPKLDGTGASGTWGISISGNAGTSNRTKFLETFYQNSTTDTYGSLYPIWAQWSDSTNVRLKCTDYTVWTDKATYATSAGSVTWDNVTGKPTTFSPSTHNHSKSQITDFAHGHTGSEVTLTGYSHRDSYETIKETDTVNQAIAKLEGALSGLEDLLASI